VGITRHELQRDEQAVRALQKIAAELELIRKALEWRNDNPEAFRSQS